MLSRTFVDEGFYLTRPYSSAEANDVCIRPDGSIIVAGAARDGGSQLDRFLMYRFRSDGIPDPAFSGDGKAPLEVAGVAFAVACQLDGRVLAAGLTGNGVQTPFDFQLARINRDGALDPTFSSDGRQTLDFGGNDVAETVAVQPDGRILVAGDQLGTPALLLARLDPDGRLDRGFSHDGRQSVRVNTLLQTASLALQRDGAIIAAVEPIRGLGRSDVLVARFLGGPTQRRVRTTLARPLRRVARQLRRTGVDRLRRRRGVLIPGIRALEPGIARIVISLSNRKSQAGAGPARAARTLATGSRRFARAGTAAVTARPTAAGRALLRTGGATVTVRLSFDNTAGQRTAVRRRTHLARGQ